MKHDPLEDEREGHWRRIFCKQEQQRHWILSYHAKHVTDNNIPGRQRSEPQLISKVDEPTDIPAVLLKSSAAAIKNRHPCRRQFSPPPFHQWHSTDNNDRDEVLRFFLHGQRSFL